ncbi:MAG: hypothetical protein NTW48_09290 [Chloroflexi bacterium]|nr:hypothetical protein [Chloroflexota bacterium]
MKEISRFPYTENGISYGQKVILWNKALENAELALSGGSMRYEDVDDTGVYTYFGYSDQTLGTWMIKRMTNADDSMRYAAGLGVYSDAWTDRYTYTYTY